MTSIDNNMPFATLCLVPFSSLMPNLCEVSTVNPVLSPVEAPITINMIVPVEPTAASAFEPTNLPTIMESTALYIC